MRPGAYRMGEGRLRLKNGNATFTRQESMSAVTRSLLLPNGWNIDAYI